MNQFSLELAKQTCKYLYCSKQTDTLLQLSRVCSLWRDAALSQLYCTIKVNIPQLKLPRPALLESYSLYTKSVSIYMPSTSIPLYKNNIQSVYNSHSEDLTHTNLTQERTKLPSGSEIERSLLSIFSTPWLSVKRIEFYVNSQLNWFSVFEIVSNKLPNLESIQFILTDTCNHDSLLIDLNYYLAHKKLSFVDISFKFSEDFLPEKNSLISKSFSKYFMDTIFLNSRMLNSIEISSNFINGITLFELVDSEKALKKISIPNILEEDLVEFSNLSNANFIKNQHTRFSRYGNYQSITLDFLSSSITSLDLKNIFVSDGDFELPCLAHIFPRLESLKIDKIMYFEKQIIGSKPLFRVGNKAFNKLFSSYWPNIKKLYLPSISDKDAINISKYCTNIEELTVNQNGNNICDLTIKGLSALINSLPKLKVLNVPKLYLDSNVKNIELDLLQGYDSIEYILHKYPHKNTSAKKDKILYANINEINNNFVSIAETKPLINWGNSKLVKLDISNWQIGILDLISLVSLISTLKNLKTSSCFSSYSVLKNNAIHLSELEYLKVLGINPFFPNLDVSIKCSNTLVSEFYEELCTLKTFFYKATTQ
ncbi:hypothetical protein BB561_003075 [Smittium simulii]|uniref:F-box domain-containing protein n=1 Tax=Smittium simulii TaxID=133385 RepID=A0A2T9YMY0_9FUNG|nr:hypothetical protein BB561_003075 [Smittium simulii]